MPQTLALTPLGRLKLVPDPDPDGASFTLDPQLQAAFEQSSAEGLFALGALRDRSPSAAAFLYWQDFASAYLQRLCQVPESVGKTLDPIGMPDSTEVERWLLQIPPAPGSEYISRELLARIWRELDEWVRAAVSKNPEGCSGFLGERAPLWHQIGRVCFHLAENKRDASYPFAFMATYSPRLSNKAVVQHLPLQRALQEYGTAGEREKLIRLLTPIHRASSQSTFVARLVESGDIYHPHAWGTDEAFTFLREIPLYEQSGLLVRVPNWWKKRPRPRVQITLGQTASSGLSLNTLLDFDLQLALGDEALTPAERALLLNASEPLIFLKGQWVEVDRDKLNEALQHWERVKAQADKKGLSFIEGMRLLAGASASLDATYDETVHDWSTVHAGQWLQEQLAQMRDPSEEQGILPGKSLHATLRSYQEKGARWLWFLTRLGLGACLADDMGLGKTIQVIALLLMLKRERKQRQEPSLLVLPASLLGNWKAELERFAPSIKTCFVHPSENQAADTFGKRKSYKEYWTDCDLIVTTYGMLTRNRELSAFDWNLVILDEAQAIKNPLAKQTQSAKQLKSRARIALTGTPIENRLGDIWSLFDFICPGLLGSSARFKNFVKMLNGRTGERFAPLRRLVQPYILRRLKTDRTIVSDLPDKTEVTTYCGLSKSQAGLYARSVKELQQRLSVSDGIQRRGLVLAYLMRFKQICNHPAHALGAGEYLADESGKFLRLQNLIEEIAQRQEKVLLFTQFREMTEPLAAYLTELFGRPGAILHGGVAVKKRKELVDAFQQEEGPPFFVLSLKAGGTGLNLTAASHVIHFDRWWNPAVENQATDRAFRIGQHKNVLVHKFVCTGTIEERIDALIGDKQGLARDVLEGGAETLLTEMSDQELLAFVRLDLDKATV